MLYVQSSEGSVEAASKRLIIAAAKRGMRAVVRHTMKWPELDLSNPHGAECRIYEFCNVVCLREALEDCPLAATVLPYRVAVYRDCEGVKLAMMRIAEFLPVLKTVGLNSPLVAAERRVADAIREAAEEGAGDSAVSEVASVSHRLIPALS